MKYSFMVAVFICLFLTAFIAGCSQHIVSQPSLSTSTVSSGCGVSREAMVTEVVDGDTIHVRFPDGSKEKVRFLGIDAPEIHPADNAPGEYAPLSDDQCLGAWAFAAKKYLSSRLNGKPVVLMSDCREGERDRYGRYLAYVSLPDGTDLNAAMIRQGYARAYTLTKAERLPSYLALEQDARRSGAGMWDQHRANCTYPY
jgi:micrococcal nuclease